MPRYSNVSKPHRILDQHNKVIQRANSDETRARVSRKVFEALRQQFYDRTDARARSNHDEFHHAYEWGATGEPSARLFKFTSKNRGKAGFEISYDYLPSTTDNGNGHIFADKVRIMEEGIPVSISPVNAEKLAFEVDGEMVYTTGPVEVTNPGGDAVKGALRRSFMALTTPSALQRNSTYQAIVRDEMSRVMSQISRARFR